MPSGVYQSEKRRGGTKGRSGVYERSQKEMLRLKTGIRKGMKNSEKTREKISKALEGNKNGFKHGKSNSKDYRKNHDEKYKPIRRQKRKQRRKTDSKFRLDSNISCAISSCLDGKKWWRRWQDLVGYTIEDLIKHLESKFEPWMTWDNYGKWEVDHIKPKSLFHYETAEDPKFKECWALENLQPLEKAANRKKYNKIIN
jgi:5-methylcytosine-specific restriction endonuclease McrA